MCMPIETRRKYTMKTPDILPIFFLLLFKSTAGAKLKIGIIGAGAAGLAAIHHCLEYGHDCIAFEQTTKVGGTWNYNDKIDKDENGLPVHSSMYEGLITNLPKELMEYEDFSYTEIEKSFIDHETVLNYIRQYANRFNLSTHIKFSRHVIGVSPVPDDKWKVTEKNLNTDEATEHIFDAIMVCVGHFSVPKYPSIAGMELLGDRALHSHYYRKTGPYKGKKVLTIGGGSSGSSISTLVAAVADKVYISYNSTLFGSPQKYATVKPLVKKFQENKAIFVDGTEVEFDNVIFCTGYIYSYPFLSPECGIKVDHQWVKYLFKHIVNVEKHTMGFLGVAFQACLFPLYDLQVKFFLEFIKNATKFTKEEMIEDILKDKTRKAVPSQYVHRIGISSHQSHFDDLANTMNIKKVKPVIHKLFKHLVNSRDLSKRYRLINEEEFMEY